MANQLLRSILKPLNGVCLRVDRYFSMIQAVARRPRDPTFEKYMDNYKHFNKVVMIQDLILSDPSSKIPPSVSIDFLSKLAQKLHLHHGARSFLRKYPHVFKICKGNANSSATCELTEKVMEISRLEAEAIRESLPLVVERIVRLLSMSLTKSLPLRAIFKVWRELGLPDDFRFSVLAKNPHLFSLSKGNQLNTHVLHLVASYPSGHFTAAVEDWRVLECCKDDARVDRTGIRYSFKQQFPPKMKLLKTFKMQVKEWQEQRYIGPYEELRETRTKSSRMYREKRAVAILHEFMSLTVEKMIDVEKITQFRNWFGIDFNIRELFLHYPGIFYLTTKGKTHTVFLREAYERGRLINSNPVYEARMKLLYLVMCEHRGMQTAAPSFVNQGADTSDKIDDQISSSSTSENEEDVF